VADLERIVKVGKGLQIFAVSGLAVSQFYSWIDFFSYSRRTGFSFTPVGIFITLFVAAYTIYFTIRIARNAKGFTWVSCAVFLNAFLLLIVDFAGFYWRFGTAPNFNATLSRLDALYFTLGTLTTAGTGSITPESQLARGLVSIQMILDLMLVAVAATIIVARLSEWLPKSKPSSLTKALMQAMESGTAFGGSKSAGSPEVSAEIPVAAEQQPDIQE
jgi:hypothetical protein